MCAEIGQVETKHNSFIKIIYFNDYPATCLINSGTSHVLVRASLAERTAVNVRRMFRPLYSVGDSYLPSVATLGEAHASFSIDGTYAEDHPVCMVADLSIPVYVLVGRTWLNLPHINYYKRGNEFVIEALGTICPTATAENDTKDVSDIHTALVDANIPTPLPLVEQDVIIDPRVTADERTNLLKVINKYRDVFAKNLSELGCTDLLYMEIVETPGSVPVCQRPYRTSPSDRRIISNILDEWRAAGIVSDSTSSYASPVLLVNKGNGEKRLCMDFRRLNQQTVDQRILCPKSMSFSVIWRKGGYFQRWTSRTGFYRSL